MARGMPCSPACAAARARSRLATAASRPRVDARKAGINRRLIRAVPRMPQRIISLRPSASAVSLELREHTAVELFRLTARNRQRLPLSAAHVLGEQQDLIRVPGVMRHLAAD